MMKDRYLYLGLAFSLLLHFSIFQAGRALRDAPPQRVWKASRLVTVRIAKPTARKPALKMEKKAEPKIEKPKPKPKPRPKPKPELKPKPKTNLRF